MSKRYPVRNRAQTKHLLRCEGEDAQHDHRRLKGNKERTAAQERLDDKQVKRASKRVRFRQDMFYPVQTDELYCPLEPGDSLPLHSNPHMAVLDRLWTDELTDGEADHVADWTHYFSHSPNTGEDDPPDTRWEEICAFSGVKSGCEIPNLMDEVTHAYVDSKPGRPPK